MCQYADAFRNATITGFDFPSLLEDNGRLLETELGISSTTARAKIMSVIRMKLLGVAKALKEPVLQVRPSEIC